MLLLMNVPEEIIPAFEAAVKEANVFAVMAAYNKFGVLVSENDYLLNQILKRNGF